MPTQLVVPRPSRLIVVLSMTLIACSAYGRDGSVAGTRSAVSAVIPMFEPPPSLSIERDMPPAVQKRIEREQRATLARLRAASKLPVSTAAGCEPSGIRGAPGGLGPPAPDVTPRIIGHHVEVVVSYPRLPSSDACRPRVVTIVVYNGEKASATFNNAVGDFLVSGARGRVVVDLPWFGRPPYRLIASSTTLLGLRGRSVERSLPCTGTGDLVKGCLRGYRPPPHTRALPKPILPLRGVDRSSLEASLRYVMAQQRPKPLSSSCPSLRSCVMTYVDPSFPRSPYRVRYRIAGQQLAGCWMAMREGPIDPLPYEDAGQGHFELAGCLSRLR